MQADKRMVRIVRHEYTLHSPAHHTEVVKALVAAERDREEATRQHQKPSDIHVRSEDDLVVIGFEAELPAAAVRGAAPDGER